MGPEYAKFLWWKKYMTELQIVSDIWLVRRSRSYDHYQIGSSIDFAENKKRKYEIELWGGGGDKNKSK